MQRQAKLGPWQPPHRFTTVPTFSSLPSSGGLGICWSLELDSASLANGRLFNGFHLAFQARKLGSVLLVATDQKQRRPEHDGAHCRSDCVLRCLTVLSASGSG